MQVRSSARSAAGFTKTELAIVAVVFLLIAAILLQIMPVIGSAMRGARGKAACINNLAGIEKAVQAWAKSSGISSTNSYSLSDPTVLKFLPASTLPVCPLGGLYTAGTNVADRPKCSFPGHSL
ncbi:MAG: hypothetical protein HY300_00390 [Verrucomicrobia bacterium]|nr:hypothetical protein [Verrucomicrobiota bacterium]